MRAHTPTLALDQPEHIPETFHHQSLILLPGVGGPDTALTHHVVDVVGMHPLVALHAARQIHVVHGNLRQRELSVVAVHVRHLFVHKGRPAEVAVLDKDFVFRLVEVVCDGGVARYPRLLPLFGECLRVVEFTGVDIVDVQFAGEEHDIHFPDSGIVGLVLKTGDAEDHALLAVGHAPGRLIAELAADKARIAVAPVFGDLLAEPEHGGWQGVPELLSQALDGLGHLLPLVGVAKHSLEVARPAV